MENEYHLTVKKRFVHHKPATFKQNMMKVWLQNAWYNKKYIKLLANNSLQKAKKYIWK